MRSKKALWLMVPCVLLTSAFAGLLLTAGSNTTVTAAPPTTSGQAEPQATGDYVVLAWNDLGMHCYNPDFQDIGVLPPWNTLWAQVIRIGDPPQIVTSGLSVEFFFEDNTYSVGKSDFWDASPYRSGQNAQLLFNLPAPLADDTGLSGTGLSGEMEARGDHFVAEGIPLTEYQDSAPTTRYPYQIATIVVRNAGTHEELARTRPVAPVSTEMHCDNCHYDNGPGNEDFATGVIEQNILLQHDDENMDEYPPGHEGPLMDRRPVLCAECHASNALGELGIGVPSVPNLSEALHEAHEEEVTQDLEGCYNCHPGPQTECLRDVMYTQYEMDCVDCHGPMSQVAQNPEPWLNEPRCDNVDCHGSAYSQDQALYRMSTEHGGVYCAACHDSPHAIAPSGESNDALKFVGWQGHNGPLDTCTVCHASWPTEAGPHGLLAPPDLKAFAFEPDHSGSQEPGTQAVYVHTLKNTGTMTDTYDLSWSSSQDWAIIVTQSEPPITLPPNATALVTVTISVPESEAVRGLLDTTIVTATSVMSPTSSDYVTDKTMVPRMYLYLPIIMRDSPSP